MDTKESTLASLCVSEVWRSKNNAETVKMYIRNLLVYSQCNLVSFCSPQGKCMGRRGGQGHARVNVGYGEFCFPRQTCKCSCKMLTGLVLLCWCEKVNFLYENSWNTFWKNVLGKLHQLSEFGVFTNEHMLMYSTMPVWSEGAALWRMLSLNSDLHSVQKTS